MTKGISLNGTPPSVQTDFSAIEKPDLSSFKGAFDSVQEMTADNLKGALEKFNTVVDSMDVVKNMAEGNITDVLKSVAGLTETFLDNLQSFEAKNSKVEDPQAFEEEHAFEGEEDSKQRISPSM
jgi:hypothetical protein